MNTLLYDFNSCYVRRGNDFLESGAKPDFSFDYQALEYNGSVGRFRNNDVDVDLTDAQIQEIEDYITDLVTDSTAQTNFDSHLHLVETDWYVTRYAETGVAIPQDILDSRAAARAAIVADSDD